MASAGVAQLPDWHFRDVGEFRWESVLTLRKLGYVRPLHFDIIKLARKNIRSSQAFLETRSEKRRTVTPTQIQPSAVKREDC